MPKFSVCMSVYHGDNATFFKKSIDSLLSQTRKPDEIVLVVDGPVGDGISKVISYFETSCDYFRVIRLEKNSGHTVACQTGLNVAKFEYIAIMDSDDIAVPDRFEKQMAYIEAHPDVDALGGQIDEFIGEPSNVVGSRIVPLTDNEIKAYLKSRCPMNLVTMMLKKDAVQKAGNYIDWYCEEDYYLWVRMTELGLKFANLPDNLVNVRVGKEMYQRRGGIRYFESEVKLQKYMLSRGIISFPRYCYNVAIRLTVQVLMPASVRSWAFNSFARK